MKKTLFTLAITAAFCGVTMFGCTKSPDQQTTTTTTETTTPVPGTTTAPQTTTVIPVPVPVPADQPNVVVIPPSNPTPPTTIVHVDTSGVHASSGSSRTGTSRGGSGSGPSGSTPPIIRTDTIGGTTR